MKEDYVSLEVAKLLKEKGFDEPCDFIYDGDKLEWIFYKFIFMNGILTNSKFDDDKIVSAPTLQMAMKWLREKHWVISVHPCGFDAGGECHWYKADIWGDDNYQFEYDESENREKETYESACEDAIKWCLINWF